MKKSIVLTLIVALLVAITSSVFAATVETRDITTTLSVVPSEAKNGDTLTVTVTFSEPVSTGRFTLNYADSLEYVSGEAVEGTSANAVHAGWLGSEKTSLTFTFKVDGEAGADSFVAFAPTQLVSSDEHKLVSNEPRVDFKIASAEEDRPTQPTQPTQPDENSEDGRPTKYPKTGINYVVAGGIVVSLVALAIVSKKM